MNDPSPYVLLYLAFGPQKHLDEVKFSLLTAQHFLLGGPPTGGRVAVVTDAPEQFRPLVGDRGTVHPVDAAQLAAWQEPDGYFYRIKVEALALALREHQLPTLMVDGDTYFTAHPDPLMAQLAPGTAIMDRPDGLIYTEPQYAAFAGLLDDAFPDHRIPLPDGKSLVINPATLTMWIAGAVGVHHADAGLVDEVRAVIDVTNQRRRTFNVEQYAFAHVLQDGGKLERSDGTIEHYWGDWVDPYFGVGKRQFITRQYESVLREAAGKPLEEQAAMAGRLKVKPFKRPTHYRVMAKVAKLLARPIDKT